MYICPLCTFGTSVHPVSDPFTARGELNGLAEEPARYWAFGCWGSTETTNEIGNQALALLHAACSRMILEGGGVEEEEGNERRGHMTCLRRAGYA